MHTLRAVCAADGRLHAETLVCASALVAGFTAQRFGPPNDALKWAFGYSRGGALAAGLAQNDLPDVGDHYSHVAVMLSGQTQQFSVGRNHQPLIEPFQLMTRAWGSCHNALIAIPPVVRERAGAARDAWPLLAGYAAGQFIAEVRSVLHPRIALVLAFESSIYGSKLNPVIVGETGQPSMKS